MNPEEMRGLYMQGYSIPRVARQLNVSNVQVERAVKHLTEYQMRLRKSAQADLMRHLYRQGLTQSEIAQHLGVTQSHVAHTMPRALHESL
jgi:DNA-binding transcriptional regulator LsrR (DeoR family)